MTQQRRSTLRTVTVGALALALAVAGCGAKTKDEGAAGAPTSGGAATSGSDVLNVPYLADMSVPDPDVFYDIEGNSVILNTYEGLVKYAPDSTKIVGSLAESFERSEDRLTYTFKLKPGVKFHSGAEMTSKDVKASFERRADVDVDEAPAYMVAPIASMSTPEPLTFVVKLKSPVDPFLAYMASSWGPKVIGPAALKTNAGKDFGQTWMRTHVDGTGPFTLTAFDRGRQYTLTRNDAYHGDKPFFREVNLKITPDINSQRLQLQAGDLDGVLHSFPASQLESLPEKLKVQTEPSFLRLLMYVNTNKAPFDDPAVRRGLRATLDTDQLVSQAYNETATKSVGPYPTALLDQQPALPYAPDPDAAKTAASKAKTKKISMAYTADESGVQRRVSELLQAQLTQAGYDVTLKEVQLPQTYAYVEDLGKAPDILLATNTPDAAHPDTWARIMFQSKGGLNFLGYENKALDTALDDALPATGEEAAGLYRKVGQQIIDSDSLFFLGDVKDVFVLADDLTGVEHVPAYPWTVSYAALKRGDGTE